MNAINRSAQRGMLTRCLWDYLCLRMTGNNTLDDITGPWRV